MNTLSSSTTAKPQGLKTWSALLANKRRPSEYEIVTHGLHYRNRKPDAPYELDSELMMNRWYKQHVVASPLKHANWDTFRDPDQVTYRAYVTMQDGQEEYVDGLLREHAARGHDTQLPAAWLSLLGRLYTPMRYLCAAQQMEMAYAVQMAPASTITNCAAFQEADAVRWLSRVAYRTRELANSHPSLGFADQERHMWETLPAWQGIREAVEKLLTTYEWGENLIAANVVVLRCAEECLRQFAKVAHQQQDTLTAMLIEAQLLDAERSRRWTISFVKHALETEGNRELIGQWVERWMVLGQKAIEAYCAELPDAEAAAHAALKGVKAFQADAGLA